jgi:hypothetical protein
LRGLGLVVQSVEDGLHAVIYGVEGVKYCLFAQTPNDRGCVEHLLLHLGGRLRVRIAAREPERLSREDQNALSMLGRSISPPFLRTSMGPGCRASKSTQVAQCEQGDDEDEIEDEIEDEGPSCVKEVVVVG